MITHQSVGLLFFSLIIGISSLGSGVLTNETSDVTRIEIPKGKPPKLNGSIGNREWKDALQLDCEGESKVYFKHDGTNLYIGIKATPLGVANVYLKDEQGIHVLHASGAIGSVLFTPTTDNSSWQTKDTFDWQLSTFELNPIANKKRTDYLERFGWVAPNGRVGAPAHWEFIIKLERLGHSQDKTEANDSTNAFEMPVKMAICYLDNQTGTTVLRFPLDLKDDCTDTELQSGNIADLQHFDPDTWATLTLK